MRLAPGLYLRLLLTQAAIMWVLVRLGLGVLAFVVGSKEPAALAPGSALLLIGLVSAITWLDLGRRNLLILLPNLGLPIAGALAMAAGVAAIAELTLALIAR